MSKLRWILPVAVLVVCSVSGLAHSKKKACLHVAGQWSMVVEIDKTRCKESKSTSLVVATMKQKGCNVTLEIPGVTLKGFVKGNKIRVTGSYYDSGTIKKWIRLTVLGRNLFGSERWTYQYKKSYKCAGTSKFAGFRK